MIIQDQDRRRIGSERRQPQLVCRRARRAPAKGLTLVELMVTGAIILMFALVGYPAFNNWIDKSRILAVVQSAAARMQVARQEAIKMNVDVVAQPDLANDEIVYFANVDGDPDFEFNPDPSVVHRTADYEISRLTLPEAYGIQFWAAGDNNPGSNNVIDGLTETIADDNAVVFRPDGSVRDSGAIRVADARGNFFEIRIEPQTTGKVEVLKYNRDPAWGGSDGFFPRGRHPVSNSPQWVWY